MNQVYAQILGRHASEVISKTSDFIPTGIMVIERPTGLPRCELAVRINLVGTIAGNKPIVGYVLGGSVEHEGSRPLLAAMAEHFGLDGHLADSPDGAADILSEFLNITIGLAEAEWADHGLTIDFSPPENICGQSLPSFDKAEAAFHIIISAKGTTDVHIAAVFSC